MSEDERQLLSKIDSQIFQINRRTYEIAEQLQRIDHRLKTAGAAVNSALFGLGVGLVAYMADKLYSVNAYWVFGALLAGLIIFGVVQRLWQKFRIWWRVWTAAAGAWDFKVGDRVSAWGRFHRVPRGSKGTVVEKIEDEGSCGVAVKWDNGTDSLYFRPLYFLDKVAQQLQ
jgi:hypothetical protein